MADYRSTFAKRQREMDQKDRAKERAQRRQARKARGPATEEELTVSHAEANALRGLGPDNNTEEPVVSATGGVRSTSTTPTRK